MWGCCRIYVYGRVYLRLMLCVPRGILGITMECRCGQYSVTNCRNVGAMFPPSIFEDRCVNLRRSMCRLSKIDDRCVHLRGSMIDVSTFEDGWSMCRPSKIDGRCVDLEDRWSMWNYVATLAQNIDGIVVCELHQGFALQCFHWSCQL